MKVKKKTRNAPFRKKAKRVWSNPSILKILPNPSKRAYEIKIDTPEFSCIGSPDQPDYANITLLFYPKKSIIELRSLKLYFYDFRNRHISYERVINVIYEDLMRVYKPDRLRIVIVFNPRGGMTSELKKDSDWKKLGGKEKYRDWIGKD